MSFSLLTIVIFGITAAIIYKEIRKGYKHGLSRSLMNVATLIFCAIFSSIVSILVAMLLGTMLMGIFRESEVLEILTLGMPLLEGVVEMLLKMLLSVLLFLIVFYLLKNLVLRLVQLVVGIAAGRLKRIKKSVRKTPEYLSEDESFYVKNDKKLGAAVGALAGLILSVIVFMPLMGILKGADEVVDLYADMTQNEAVTETEGAQALDHYANDTAGSVLYSCGGKALFRMTATTRMHGYTTSLHKEVSILKSIDLLGVKNELQESKSLTSENASQVEKLLDNTKNSLTIKMIMTDVLKDMSSHWMERSPYLGIDRPNLGSYGELDNFFDSVLSVCSTTTVETYDADIRTVMALVTILEDNDVFFAERNYEAFMKNFVEGNTLKRIEDELARNPRMNSVNYALDDLLMTIVTTELMNDSKYSLEQKALFYREIAGVMRDSQGLDGSVQLVAISNGVSESFNTLGLYLPESLENRVATIFTANIPINEGVTENEVEDLFDKYKKES